MSPLYSIVTEHFSYNRVLRSVGPENVVRGFKIRRMGSALTFLAPLPSCSTVRPSRTDRAFGVWQADQLIHNVNTTRLLPSVHTVRSHTHVMTYNALAETFFEGGIEKLCNIFMILYNADIQQVYYFVSVRAMLHSKLLTDLFYISHLYLYQPLPINYNSHYTKLSYRGKNVRPPTSHSAFTIASSNQ